MSLLDCECERISVEQNTKALSERCTHPLETFHESLVVGSAGVVEGLGLGGRGLGLGGRRLLDVARRAAAAEQANDAVAHSVTDGDTGSGCWRRTRGQIAGDQGHGFGTHSTPSARTGRGPTTARARAQAEQPAAGARAPRSRRGASAARCGPAPSATGRGQSVGGAAAAMRQQQPHCNGMRSVATIFEFSGGRGWVVRDWLRGLLLRPLVSLLSAPKANLSLEIHGQITSSNRQADVGSRLITIDTHYGPQFKRLRTSAHGKKRHDASDHCSRRMHSTGCLRREQAQHWTLDRPLSRFMTNVGFPYSMLLELMELLGSDLDQKCE